MTDVTKQSNAPDVTSGTTSGMTVSSQVSAVIVKPTSAKTIEGSTPGDHRAPNTGANTTDSLKNQAGPRGEMGTKGC